MKNEIERLIELSKSNKAKDKKSVTDFMDSLFESFHQLASFKEKNQVFSHFFHKMITFGASGRLMTLFAKKSLKEGFRLDKDRIDHLMHLLLIGGLFSNKKLTFNNHHAKKTEQIARAICLSVDDPQITIKTLATTAWQKIAYHDAGGHQKSFLWLKKYHSDVCFFDYEKQLILDRHDFECLFNVDSLKTILAATKTYYSKDNSQEKFLKSVGKMLADVDYGIHYFNKPFSPKFFLQLFELIQQFTQQPFSSVVEISWYNNQFKDYHQSLFYNLLCNNFCFDMKDMKDLFLLGDFLIQQGDPVMVCDKNGYSLLHALCYKPEHIKILEPILPQIIQWFEKQGGDIFKQNNDGNTVIDLICHNSPETKASIEKLYLNRLIEPSKTKHILRRL